MFYIRPRRFVYCFMALAETMYIDAADVILWLHDMLCHLENFSL